MPAPAPLPLCGSLPPAVGTKASLLATCARAGLAVPVAVLVPTELIPAEPTTATVAAALGPLPAPLAEVVRRGGYLAVRSAFSNEDCPDASHAGAYLSVLDVPADDARAWATAICRVWASGERAGLGSPPPARRDVLVMAQIRARRAGAAVTEPDWEDDLVDWTAGLGAGLLQGRTPGHRLLLPRRGRHEGAGHGRDGGALPGWARRLTRLLARVRSVLGAGRWDVEWADDGRTCFLLQVRPVTAAPRRSEALSQANLRELLPPVPSTFMTSLMLACEPALAARYRRAVPTLPSGRPLLVLREGRPYLSLGLLEDMVRRLGLPPTWLAQVMGGQPDARTGLSVPRVLRQAPLLARMAVAQLRAPGRWDRRGPEVRRLADLPGDPVEAACSVYTEVIAGILELQLAAGPPVVLLRATGTLAPHARRHAGTTTRMWAELAVRDGRPDDAWLDAYGHRGAYETDFGQPRFGEVGRPGEEPRRAPDCPATASDDWADGRVRAGGPPGSTGSPAGGGPLGLPRLRMALTWPLWWQARRALDARERWRDQGMRAFALVRHRLLASDADFASCTIDEVRAGRRPAATELRARAADRARWETWAAPATLRSDEDARQWYGRGARAPEGESLHGLGLTTGVVEGIAWVCSRPDASAPGLVGTGTMVLVAPAIDAGWIPTLARVAAVAVDLGGDLSHGSVLLREAGLPAVTNLGSACTLLRTGDRVELDADAATLRLLARADA